MTTNRHEAVAFAGPDYNERCANLLLANAGLAECWRPSSISTDLVTAAVPLISASMNTEEAGEFGNTPLQPDLQGFGTHLLEHIPRFWQRPERRIIGPRNPSFQAFRAHHAFKQEQGNCIAYNEVSSGVLATLGLGNALVASWYYNHASTRLVVDEEVLIINAQTKEFELLKPTAHDNEIDAHQQVVETGMAAFLTRNKAGSLWNVSLAELAALSEITIDDKERQALLLPAHMMVVMFCGMLANKGGQGQERVASVLAPYAPKLKTGKAVG